MGCHLELLPNVFTPFTTPREGDASVLFKFGLRGVANLELQAVTFHI